jgi:hypothetical protein
MKINNDNNIATVLFGGENIPQNVRVLLPGKYSVCSRLLITNAFKLVEFTLCGVYGSYTAYVVSEWLTINFKITTAKILMDDIIEELDVEKLLEVNYTIKERCFKNCGVHNRLLTIMKGLNVPANLLPVPIKKTAKSARKKKKTLPLHRPG